MSPTLKRALSFVVFMIGVPGLALAIVLGIAIYSIDTAAAILQALVDVQDLGS